MFLKNLILKNFRNYSHLDFNFEKPIVVLVGNNAQGKTNFLESIYFLASAKSAKAEKDEELIFSGNDSLHVKGQLENGDTLEIAMQLVTGRLLKRVKVNGVGKRVADYSQNLVVVFFTPEDINMVSGSPSLRRSHVDQTLSQIDREYKRSLSQYENIITRKNKVLKSIRDGFAKVDELLFWQDQQVLFGQILLQKRKDFFNYLNSVDSEIGSNLGEFEYQYLPNEITIERLHEYQSREIDSASSLIGPHRDDFNFLLYPSATPQDDMKDTQGRDLSKFGSRGEQRTAVLNLKFLEIFFVEKVLGARPILLLDDIFSELDDNHRDYVIGISKLQQTIISTVEWDKHLEKEFKDSANLYYVENGQISLKDSK